MPFETIQISKPLAIKMIGLLGEFNRVCLHGKANTSSVRGIAKWERRIENITETLVEFEREFDKQTQRY